MNKNKSIELSESHRAFLDNARREQEKLIISMLETAGASGEKLEFLKHGIAYLQDRSLGALSKVAHETDENLGIAFIRSFVAGLSLAADAVEESFKRQRQEHPELYTEAQRELPRSTAN